MAIRRNARRLFHGNVEPYAPGASVWTSHVASEDYPELAEILVERPPLEGSKTVTTSYAELVEDSLEAMAKTASVETEEPLAAEAGIRDWLLDKGKEWADSGSWEPGRVFSVDWCRFRRDSHCYYPKHLNKKASEEAGYAVWIPVDRGICPRDKWADQKNCPAPSEPGPNSKEPRYGPDATIPWEEGGQRYASVPVTLRRKASDDLWPDEDEPIWAVCTEGHVSSPRPSCQHQLVAEGLTYAEATARAKDRPATEPETEPEFDPDDPVRSYQRIMRWHERNGSLQTDGDGDWGFHFTAAWDDVRSKAKAIRERGQVRILSVTGGYIAGEVKGDSAVYQTTIMRTPGKKSVAMWECNCKWSTYSWGRSGKWKRYEGRMCAHALALVYEAQNREMFGGTIQEDEKDPEWLRNGHRHASVAATHEAEWDDIWAISPEAATEVASDAEALHLSLYMRRGAALMGERLWWRVHPHGREFSPESATSFPLRGRPWDVPAEGFSAFKNPWHLLTYLCDMGWLSRGSYVQSHKDDVIGFTGTEVDKGHDREPLVVPDMKIVERYSFEDWINELIETPLPSGTWNGWDWESYAADMVDSYEAAGNYSWDDSHPAALALHTIIAETGMELEVAASRKEASLLDTNVVKYQDRVLTVDSFDGETLMTSNGPIPADQVVYPNWNPLRGLASMRSSHKLSELMGGRTTLGPFMPAHKLAMSLPGIHDESTIEEIAEALLNKVRQEEPKVTRDFKNTAEREGGKMEGLDFRIKSKDSLVRKLDLKATTKGLSPIQLTDAVKDVLRYTMVFSPIEWGDMVQDTLWALEDKGYRIVEEENFWEKGDDYSGLHYTIKTPGDVPVELQFHSDDSFELKERTLHKIYEEMRDKNTPLKRKQELFDIMTTHWEGVDLPDFALEFPELKRHQRPASKIAGQAQTRSLDLDGLKVTLELRGKANAGKITAIVEGGDYAETQMFDGVLVWTDAYYARNKFRRRDHPEILQVSVQPEYRRKGLAKAMLEWAREVSPDLRHSETLSDDGRAWSQAVGSKTTSLTFEAENYGGVMVAIRPPDKVCNALYSMLAGVYDEGEMEDVDNYHVTLAFIPKGDMERSELEDRAREATQEWAKRWQPFEGHLGGFGVFHNGDKVLVALVDAPRLEALREDLLEVLSAHGLDASDDHGYTAHLTLGYFGEANTPAPPQDFDGRLTDTFEFAYAIASTVDGEWTTYDFEGPRVATEAILHDEPEPALPEVYGVEDDEDDDEDILYTMAMSYTHDDLAGNAGRTQISRGDKVSNPTKMLIQRGLIRGRVLHHGAGRAQADTRAMLEAGADEVVEYDPYHPIPEGRDRSVLNERYDVVVSNYVLNVLPPKQRAEVLRDLAQVTGGTTYISVRGTGDGIKGEPFEDGVYTSRGTFQKGFTGDVLADELNRWFGSVEIIAGNTKTPGTVIARVSSPHPEKAASLSKSAVRAFSPSEQNEIINEGEGVEASNLDRLDISGTHYVALEAAYSEPEDDWWLS